MLKLLDILSSRLRRASELVRLVRLARGVARASYPAVDHQPILFFNASTRLSGLSQNAAFSLLASWAVRLTGTPVVHFVCRSGMSRCVLGTDEINPSHRMPCGMCIRQSWVNYSGAEVRWFAYQQDEKLSAALRELNLDELVHFELPLPDGSGYIPLGELVLPSLRWRLRRQSIANDELTRFLSREFMLSAWNIARELLVFLDQVKPQMAVLFNGMHFPEAIAYWLCQKRGVRTVTHESGFTPFSGYFVEGQATMYPITIPDVDLTTEQNARLDEDLQKRWQGDFSMAGVKFWHEIHELDNPLKAKIASHQQTVVVFTNVIFDTSQLHANVAFRDMFDWLDTLLEVIRANSETLFIVRAHPDEARPGKTSQESVAMWMEKSGAGILENVVFISPQERLSSYNLVRSAKFILVYNSTISLESTLLGIPALCAARSPFTDFGTTYFEAERGSYLQRLNDFLVAESLHVPDGATQQTRRFMYYRYFRFSLPFGEFVESTRPTGYVRMKKFLPHDLENSPSLHALLDGLLHGKRFEMDV